MKFFLKKLLILLLLMLFFVPAVFMSFLTMFFCVFKITEQNNYILYALDKLIAATHGFSGKYTVSAECAVSTWWLYRVLRNVLNTIDEGHCEGAARHEGLIP